MLPEDIVNPKIDSFSVITYVSQFPNAKLKEGAPLKETGDAAKVKAYGDGLKAEGLTTNDVDAEFFVDVSEAGNGPLKVEIVSPQKLYIHPKVEFDENKKLFTYKYTPGEDGQYTIKISWCGKAIPNSPYLVNVVGSKQPTLGISCKVYGPGVESNALTALAPAEFWVEEVPVGTRLQVKITGPRGVLGSNAFSIENIGKGKFIVVYRPPVAGKYKIEITAAGKEISSSPYTVTVGEGKALIGWARGPGVESVDLNTGKPTWFKVFTPTASSRDVVVSIEGPKRSKITSTSVKIIDSIIKYTYTPKEEGVYKITILIGPKKTQQTLVYYVTVYSAVVKGPCKVWGPGLTPQGIQVNLPSLIFAQPVTRAEKKAVISMSITDSNGRIVAITDEEGPDEVHTFTYHPSKVGCYTISASFENSLLPDFPVKVNVTDISKVKLSGPGVDGKPIPVNKASCVLVDTTEAGPGHLECQLLNTESLNQKEAEKVALTMVKKVEDKGNGKTEIEFIPKLPCTASLAITFDDIPLPQSPLKLIATDKKPATVFGRGILDGNAAKAPTYFMVDVSKSEPGKPKVNISGPKQTIVKVTDTGKEMFKCEYTPPVEGDYTAEVSFGGIPAESSPFKFKVLPKGSPQSFLVHGPAITSNLLVGSPAEFFLVKGDTPVNKIVVMIQAPSEETILITEVIDDKITKCTFTPREPGTYKIDVEVDETLVQGSPFQTTAVFPEGVPKVVAMGKELDAIRFEGPGVESAAPGEENILDLFMPNIVAEEVTMEMMSHDHQEVPLDFLVKNIEQNHCQITFIPNVKTGIFKATLTYAGTPLGDPIEIAVGNPSKCKVSGPGIEEDNKLPVGQETYFTIDATEAGPGKPKVSITGPNDSTVEPSLTEEKPGVTRVTYTPEVGGPHEVSVLFGGHDVPGSPYSVPVCNPASVKCSTVNPGNKQYHPRDEIILTVDLKNAGEGDFSLGLMGPEDQPIVSEESFISLVPIKERVDGNTEIIQLKPEGIKLGLTFPYKIDASSVLTGDVISGRVVGPFKNKLKVPKDLMSNKITLKSLATLLSEDQTLLEPEVKEENKIYHVNITPKEVGVYILYIFLGDGLINNMPIQITITDADQVKVTGPGLGEEKGSSYPLKTPLLWEVDCTNAGPGTLAAYCAGPDDCSKKFKISPIHGKPDSYIVKYKSQKAGPYQMLFTYNGYEIPNRPTLNLSKPSFTPLYGKTEIEGMDIKQPIKGDIQHERNNDGTYTFKFKPEKPGLYQVAPKVNDYPVFEEPLTFLVIEPEKAEVSAPDTTNMKPIDSKPTKDSSLTAKVSVDTLEVGTVASVGVLPTPLEEKQLLDLQHKHELTVEIDTASYQLETSKDYQFELTSDNEPKKNIVEFEGSRVDFSTSEKENIPVYFMPKIVSDKVTMEITTQEHQEIPLEVLVKKTDDENNQTQFTSGGEAGISKSSFSYPEPPLVDPIEIAVQDASKCKVHGPSIDEDNKLLAVGKETYFTIDSTEAGPGKPKVTIIGPDENKLEHIHREMKLGVTKISYTPQIGGLHEVSVLFGGHDVPGSPYSVPVCNPASVKCSTVNPGNKQYHPRDEIILTVDLKNAGEGDFSLGLIGPEDQPIVSEEAFITLVPIKESVDGNTEIIQLKPEGIKLGSTFPYKIDASSVLTGDVISGRVVGPFKNKSKVPKDLMSNKITLKSLATLLSEDQKILEPEVKEDNKIYDVNFTPEEVGVYVLYIFLGDNLVNDMPIQITITDADQVKVTGPGLGEEKGSSYLLKTPLLWEVDCTNAGPGTLAAYCAGPDDCSKKFKISPIHGKPEFYIVKYKSQKAGPYQMLFTYNGYEIPNRPTLNLSKPSFTPLYGKTEIEGMDIKQPIKGDIQHERNNDGTYTFKFKPEKPGLYQVAPKVNDYPVFEEPLTFLVIEPEKAEVSAPDTTNMKPRDSKPTKDSSLTAKVSVDTLEVGTVAGVGVLSTPYEEKQPLDLQPKDKPSVEIHTTSYLPETSTDHQLKLRFDDEAIKKTVEFKRLKVDLGASKGDETTSKVKEHPVFEEHSSISVTKQEKVEESAPDVTDMKPSDSKPTELVVDETEAAPTAFGVVISTPSKEKQQVEFKPMTESIHETITASYTSETVGDYQLNVMVNEMATKDSSLTAKVSVETLEVGAVEGVGVLPTPYEEKQPLDLQHKHELTVEIDTASYQLETSKDYQFELTSDNEPKKNIVEFEGSRVDFSTSEKENIPVYFMPKIVSEKVTMENTTQEHQEIPLEVLVKKTDDENNQTQFTSGGEAGISKSSFSYPEPPLVDPLEIAVQDASKCKVHGPGIDEDNKLLAVGKETYFTIDSTEAGPGKPKVTIIGPDENKLEHIHREMKLGVTKISYTPQIGGLHEVSVLFGGHDVPGSPYSVPVCSPASVKCSTVNPGNKQYHPRDEIILIVDLKNAGEGDFSLGLIGPEDQPIVSEESFISVVPINEIVDGNTEIIQLKPEGIKLGSTFPYKIDASSVLTGDVISGRVVGPFKNKLKVPKDLMSNKIILKSLATLLSEDQTLLEPEVKEENKIYHVNITPKEVGVYILYIFLGDGLINDMPIQITVTDADQVKVTGPGLGEEKGSSYPLKTPLLWEVDCTNAGPGTLAAYCAGPDDCSKKFKISPIHGKPDSYIIKYKSQKAGPYQMLFTYNGYEIPNRPTLNLSKPSFTPLYGKTEIEGMDIKQPIKGDIQHERNNDGTYTFKFKPEKPGLYQVAPKVNDYPVFEEPLTFLVIEPEKAEVSAPDVTDMKPIDSKPTKDSSLTAKVSVETLEVGTVASVGVLPTPLEEKQLLDLQHKHELTVEIDTASYQLETSKDYQFELTSDNEPKKNIVEFEGSRVDFSTSEKENIPVYFMPKIVSDKVTMENTTQEHQEIPLEVLVKKTDEEDNQTQFTSGGEAGISKSSFSYPEPPLVDPIEIAVQDASKCKVHGPGIDEDNKLLAVGKETYFTIDSTEAGPGKPKVTITGPNDSKLEHIHREMKLGVTKISYTPQIGGLHEVSVLFGGHDVPGSPYSVPVCSPASVKCSTVDPGNKQYHPRDEIILIVDLKNAGEGDFSLGLIGPEDQPIVSEESFITLVPIKESVDGNTEIIQLKPEGIKLGSTFPYKIDASSVLTGDVISGRVVGPFKNKLKVPKDLMSNKIILKSLTTLLSEDQTLLEPEVKEENKIYDVNITPKEVGVYILYIFLGNSLINDMPIQITITDADQVKVTGPGLGEEKGSSYLLKTPLLWEVDCTNAGPGTLAAYCAGPDDCSKKFKISPIHGKPDSYIIKYKSQKAGPYQMLFTYNGYEIPNRPTLNLSKPSFTPLYGKTEIEGMDIKQPIEGDIQHERNNDGTYTFKFKPEKPGLYQVAPKVNDYPVFEEPLTFLVIEPEKAEVSAPDASNMKPIDSKPTKDSSLTAKVSVETLEVGAVASVGVLPTPLEEKQPLDLQHKHELTVEIDTASYQLETSKDYQFELTSDNEPKKNIVEFEGSRVDFSTSEKENIPVYFMPKIVSEKVTMENTTQEHQEIPLEVLVKKTDDENNQTQFTSGGEAGISKFSFSYPEPPLVDPIEIAVQDASKCKVHGPGIDEDNKLLAVGKETYFTIDSTEAGPGKPKVTITGPNDSKLEHIHREMKLGVTKISYTPQIGGLHEVSVLFGGHDVPGSPYSVPVCSPASVKCSTVNPGNKQYHPRDEIILIVDLKNAGEGDFSLGLIGPEDQPIVSEESFISLVPIKESVDGNTEIIQLKPEGIKLGSTFPYKIDASSVLTGDVISGRVVGPFKNKLKVPKDLMSNKITLKSLATLLSEDQTLLEPKVKEENKIYDVNITPKEVGVYILYIFLGDGLINDMPIQITITDADQVKVTGPGLGEEKGSSYPLKTPLLWEVDCTNAGPGTLAAYCAGPDNCSKKFKISPIHGKPDSYIIKYKSQKAGPYQMLFTYNGYEIPNRPTLNLSKPSFTSLYGKTEIEGMDIRQPIKGDIQHERNNDGTYTFKFKPEKPGLYQVAPKVNDYPVFEEPLTFLVIEPEKAEIIAPDVTDMKPSKGKPTELVVQETEAAPTTLGVVISTPSGEKQPVEFKPMKESIHETITASYTSETVGDYQFDVKVNEMATKDSSITAKVSVDTLEVDTVAGVGVLSTPLEEKQPLDLQPKDEPSVEIHTTSYLPETSTDHQLKLRFDDESIKETVQFKRLKVHFGASKEDETTPKVKEHPVFEEPSSISVIKQEKVEESAPDVTDMKPSDGKPISMKEPIHETITTSYTSETVGDYQLDVMVNEISTKDSSLTAEVSVDTLEVGTVAGIEVLSTPLEEKQPLDLQPKDEPSVEIHTTSYLPETSTDHQLKLRFDDEAIKETVEFKSLSVDFGALEGDETTPKVKEHTVFEEPSSISVIKQEKVEESAPDVTDMKPSDSKPTELVVDETEAAPTAFGVVISTPSIEKQPVEFKPMKESIHETITASYTSETVGDYQFGVMVNEMATKESSITAKVSVDTLEVGTVAGVGVLSTPLEVKQPLDLQPKDEPSVEIHTTSYLPETSTDHQLKLRFDDESIKETVQFKRLKVDFGASEEDETTPKVKEHPVFEEPSSISVIKQEKVEESASDVTNMKPSDGKPIPMKESINETITASYTSETVGDYQLDVKVNEMATKDSSLIAEVSVDTLEVGTVAGVGVLSTPLEVKQPLDLQPKDEPSVKIHTTSYLPETSTDHQLKLRFDDEAIKETVEFKSLIVDLGALEGDETTPKVKEHPVFEEHSSISVTKQEKVEESAPDVTDMKPNDSKPTELVVQKTEAAPTALGVVISTPSKEKQPVEFKPMKGSIHETITASYTSETVGDYQLNVMVNEMATKDSSLTAKVSVDTIEVGTIADIGVLSTPLEEKQPLDLQPKDEPSVEIHTTSYLPETSTDHQLKLRFDDEAIKETVEFKSLIVDPGALEGDETTPKVKEHPVFEEHSSISVTKQEKVEESAPDVTDMKPNDSKPTELIVQKTEAAPTALGVVISTPSKEKQPVEFKPMKGSIHETITASYTSETVGDYQLDVMVKEMATKDSRLTAKVSVDTLEVGTVAGVGVLSTPLEEKQPLNLQPKDEPSVEIHTTSYLPETCTDHQLKLRLDGEAIKKTVEFKSLSADLGALEGDETTPKVKEHPVFEEHSSIIVTKQEKVGESAPDVTDMKPSDSKPTELVVNEIEAAPTSFGVVISTPSREKQPVEFKPMKESIHKTITASYTSETVGDYQLDVMVKEMDTKDSSLTAKVSVDTLEVGTVAGVGVLSTPLEEKQPLDLQPKDEPSVEIHTTSYLPETSTDHQLKLRFDDEAIKKTVQFKRLKVNLGASEGDETTSKVKEHPVFEEHSSISVTRQEKVEESAPDVTDMKPSDSKPTELVVDETEAAPTAFGVVISTPSREKQPVEFKPMKESIHETITASYTSETVGDYQLDVMVKEMATKDSRLTAKVSVDTLEVGTVAGVGVLSTPLEEKQPLNLQPKDEPSVEIHTTSYLPETCTDHQLKLRLDGEAIKKTVEFKSLSADLGALEGDETTPKVKEHPVFEEHSSISVTKQEKVGESASDVTDMKPNDSKPTELVVDETEAAPTALGVVISTPSKEKQQVEFKPMKESIHKTITASYTSETVGDYQLDVMVNEMATKDSSLTAKVSVDTLEVGTVAGIGVLSTPLEKNQPLDLQPKDKSSVEIHTTSYLPETSTDHQLKLRFDDEAIKKTVEFKSLKVDFSGSEEDETTSKVKEHPVFEEHSSILVTEREKVEESAPDVTDMKPSDSKPTELVVDETEAAPTALGVVISTPSKEKQPVEFKPMKEFIHETITASYTSETVGDYQLDVMVKEMDTKDSSLTAKVSVDTLEVGTVAGVGVLSTPLEEKQPLNLQPKDEPSVEIHTTSYLPETSTDHQLKLRFDDEAIKKTVQFKRLKVDLGASEGDETTSKVKEHPVFEEHSSISVTKQEKVEESASDVTDMKPSDSKPTELVVDETEAAPTALGVVISTPSREKQPVEFKPMKESIHETITASYTSETVGDYQLNVMVDEMATKDSSLTAKVSVDTLEVGTVAGVGVLSTPLEEKQPLDLQPKDEPSVEIHTTSYLPETSTDHQLKLRFDDEAIKKTVHFKSLKVDFSGSEEYETTPKVKEHPVFEEHSSISVTKQEKVKESAPDVTDMKPSDSKPTELVVDETEAAPTALGVVISTPSKEKQQVEFKTMKESIHETITALYASETVGDYQLDVMVKEMATKDSSITAEVSVDTLEVGTVAGVGVLSTPLEEKQPLDLQPKDEPSVEIHTTSYLPETSTDYQLKLRFDDEAIKKTVEFKSLSVDLGASEGDETTPKVKEHPVFEEHSSILVTKQEKVEESAPDVTDMKPSDSKPTELVVDETEAAPTALGVVISTPSKEKQQVEFKPMKESIHETITASYTLVTPGDYQFDVMVNEMATKGSLLTTEVSFSKLEAGVLPTPLEVKQPLDFQHKDEQTHEILTVSAEKQPLDFHPRIESTPDTLLASYFQETPGENQLGPRINDEPMKGSPFTAKILDTDAIRFGGTGSELAASGEENILYLFMPNIVPDKVTMKMMTQDHQEIPLDFLVEKVDEDHCQITFTPEVVAGICEATLLYAGTPLGNPLKIAVGNPSKCKVSGPGIEEDNKLQVGQETYFTVDSTEAGPCKPKVTIIGPNDSKLEPRFMEEKPGVTNVTYIPQVGGPHEVSVLFGGHDVPGSPYSVPVYDPAGVKFAPVNPDYRKYRPGNEIVLVVDLKQAGEGDFSLGLIGPDNQSIISEEALVALLPIEERIGGNTEIVELKPEGLKPGSAFSYKINTSGIHTGDVISGKFVGPFKSKKKIPKELLSDKITLKSLPTLVSENQKLLEPEVKEDNKVYDVNFTPEEVGIYVLYVFLGDNLVNDMPCQKTVCNASEVKVTGPGLGDTDGESYPIGVPLIWEAYCSSAGPGKLTAYCAGPDDCSKKFKISPITGKENSFYIEYVPKKAGPYQLLFAYGDYEILQKPTFFATKKKYAVLLGIKEQEVEDDISAQKEKIGCNLNDDGTYNFTFKPEKPGLYSFLPTLCDQPVLEKPLSFLVTDPDKVEVTGPGVTGKGVRIGQPTDVIVDRRQSGPAPVEAVLSTPSGESKKIEFKPKEESEPDVLVGQYTPQFAGYHSLSFTFDDQELPLSPLRVYVVNPEEFKLEGGDLKEATIGEVNIIKCFLEDTPEDGVFTMTTENEDGVVEPLECETVKVDQDNCCIEFVPETETACFATLCFNEVPISDKIAITPNNIDGLKISGLKRCMGVLVNKERPFTADFRGFPVQEEMAISFIQADESQLQPTIIETEPGVYRIFFTPTVLGLLRIGISYGEKTMTYNVFVIDPSAVVCTGLNGESILVSEKLVFAINTSAAGIGARLNLELKGKGQVSLSCKYMINGHYAGVMSVVLAGVYDLHIFYGGYEIKGSPFKCKFHRPEPDASLCSISDLENNPGKIFVDCRQAGGCGLLEVAVLGAYVPARYITVEHNGDYTFNVAYDIPDPIETAISVKWHGEHLKGSPFKVAFKKSKL